MATIGQNPPQVQYSLNGRRSQKPSTGIENKVNAAANAVRPGTTTQIYSGQEPKGMAAVGAKNRHPNGFAGDFKFFDAATGQQIKDQDFFKELSLEMATTYGANIGYGPEYMGVGSIHIDTMPLSKYPGGAQWGSLAKSWAKELNTARKNAVEKLPDAVFEVAGVTREEALADISKQQQVAQAYQDPMRALDVVPSAPPSALNPAPVGQVARAPLDNLPSPLAPAPVGQVTRAALPDIPSALAAAPAGLVQRASLPGIPSALAAAPVGRVERAALQPANIAPSGTMVASLNAAPVGKVERGPALSPTFSTAGGKVSSLNAAPVGAVERGPALAPATRGPSTAALASQYGSYRSPGQVAAQEATDRALAERTAKLDQAAGSLGWGAPATPSTAALASQYSQYRSPTSYAGVKSQIAMDKALEDKVLAEMEMDNLAVPALAPPAPTVAAPPLAPPTVVKNYPVYQAPAAPVAPPAPPAARAYDVYSGMARSALDNTGMNTVGRLADGTTTVTNQYGKTTGMTPGGYQTAVGAISGPLGQGGIQTPSVPSQGGFMSKAGSMAKAAMPSIAGSTVGGLLGGPMGALLGAALAREATKPGGILSGMNSFNTNAFGLINAAKPQAGGRFPGAPSNPGTTLGFKDQATRDHAYGMSPGAAAAIDKGLGGLY